MKIEFGVQEYFNELKLMDAQFGQEEELYSWIYMLLQMAECRKKEILKEWYKGVSIRDVHNGQNAEDSGIKKKLRSKVGFPDHVFFERKCDKYHILGCSEIKKNDKKINLVEKQYEVSSFLSPNRVNIEFYFNIKDINNTMSKVTNDNIEGIIEKITKENNKNEAKIVDELIKNAINSEMKAAGISNEDILKDAYFRTHQKNTRSYCVELKNNKNVNEKEEIKKIKSILINEKEKLDCLKYEKITETDWSFKTELEETELPHDDVKQILSHLEKFKKVLYTNGLEFYYLVLNEKKIDVKKIADLQPMYTEYKENTTPSPQLLLAASAEWDRLIAGLTSIDWHKDPVAEIPSAQPSTEE